MSKYYIRHYKNEALAKAIVNTLYDNGHKWGTKDGTRDTTYVEKNDYDGIYFDTANKEDTLCCSSYAYFIRVEKDYTELTIDKFFTEVYSAESTISVKLNDEHTAIVSKKGIQVGCQMFPHNIVADLEKAQTELGL